MNEKQIAKSASELVRMMHLYTRGHVDEGAVSNALRCLQADVAIVTPEPELKNGSWRKLISHIVYAGDVDIIQKQIHKENEALLAKEKELMAEDAISRMKLKFDFLNTMHLAEIAMWVAEERLDEFIEAHSKEYQNFLKGKMEDML